MRCYEFVKWMGYSIFASFMMGCVDGVNNDSVESSLAINGSNSQISSSAGNLSLNDSIENIRDSTMNLPVSKESVGQCFTTSIQKITESYCNPNNAMHPTSCSPGDTEMVTHSYFIASRDTLIQMDVDSFPRIAIPASFVELNDVWVDLNSLNDYGVYSGCDTTLLMKLTKVPGYVRYSEFVPLGTIDSLMRDYYNDNMGGGSELTLNESSDDTLFVDTVKETSASMAIPSLTMESAIGPGSIAIINGKRLVWYYWTTKSISTNFITYETTVTPIQDTALLLEGTGVIYSRYYEINTLSYSRGYLYYTADTSIQMQICNTLNPVPTGFPCE